jgi:hypothetical protein
VGDSDVAVYRLHDDEPNIATGMNTSLSFQLTNPMTGPDTALPSGQEAKKVLIASEQFTDGAKVGILSSSDLMCSKWPACIFQGFREFKT